MDRIRNRGRHLHNNEAVLNQIGQLKPVYRTTKVKTKDDLNICTFCMGWFTKKTLGRHVKRCKANTNVNNNISAKEAGKLGKLLKPLSSPTTASYKRILCTLNDDATAMVVKGDSLLKAFGTRLAVKHGHDEANFVNVKTRLRMLARLLLILRENHTDITTLTDALIPANFHKLVDAAKQLSEYNESKGTYGKPGLALKIGTNLVHSIDVLHSLSIETGEQTQMLNCVNLKKLFDINWESEVTANAHRTNLQNKRNTVELLPLTDDVTKFSSYLKKTVAALVEKLDEEYDWESYVSLQRSLLTSLTLFNRKRSGEVSKTLATDYNSLVSGDTVCSTLELTKVELGIYRFFYRFEINGKAKRNVPVLVTEGMKKGMDLLIKYKDQAGLGHNKYIFCSSTGTSHLRGSDTIRRLASNAALKKPELVKSTGLRKHIATMSQILNLKDNELDTLATFMGHDIRTHRAYYRLPSAAIQVASVTKLLLAAEGGNMATLSGMSLAEIPTAAIESEYATYIHE